MLKVTLIVLPIFSLLIISNEHIFFASLFLKLPVISFLWQTVKLLEKQLSGIVWKISIEFHLKL